jgi:hypothetical protein
MGRKISLERLKEVNFEKLFLQCINRQFEFAALRDHCVHYLAPHHRLAYNFEREKSLYIETILFYIMLEGKRFVICTNIQGTEPTMAADVYTGCVL